MNIIKQKLKLPKLINDAKLIYYFEIFGVKQIISASKNKNTKAKNDLSVSTTHLPNLNDLL